MDSNIIDRSDKIFKYKPTFDEVRFAGMEFPAMM